MLIKRIFEVDPLVCPKCGSVMKVLAFIEPPQGDVIERILQHCGLWHPSLPRPPPAGVASVYVPAGTGDGQTACSEGPRELTCMPDADWDSQMPSSDEPWEMASVDTDAFEATF